MNCYICGKKMKVGEQAYATTTGSIGPLVGYAVLGFFTDVSEPWLTVACRKCGKRISDAIASLWKE